MTKRQHSDLERRVIAAGAALREHQLLTRRCAELAERHENLSAEVARLRQQLADEHHDVERLERLSLTRIVVSLRGVRDDALAKEQAEEDAAKYRVAGAVSRQTMAWQELLTARAQLANLRDAPQLHAAVLSEKEHHLRKSGDDRAGRLWQLADERGRLTSELREIDEALLAANSAIESLKVTLKVLGDAANWSTYDVFLGGGAVSGAVKHSRLDEAAQSAARADRALVVLRTELADVDGVILTSPQLAIDGFTRFADIWFDDLYSDLAVRNRIRQARHNISKSMESVQKIERKLRQRAADVHTRLSVIDAERERHLLS
ncbi:MAG: hypothetical protein ACRC0L_11030 [Angustibacter sp.]